ncbi:MAG: hypothetical protein NTY35_10405 [Planctomycetota bacterium]|nr:hypothetical protein [Planctomycetota bacterium]
MTTKVPNCRNCRSAMDEGWIADQGRHHSTVFEPKWIEGEPHHQRWMGIDWGITTKDAKQHAVTTWRCPRCGLLESYAL